MSRTQPSLFDNQRMDLQSAIDLSLLSLQSYGHKYRHWACAYSGGKDSSATVTFIAWAIKNKLVPHPDSFTVLYADTRMELPPLQRTAMRILETMRMDGFNAKVVLPEMDNRFYVYMLGRGVPPPKNRFRWCTPQIKVEPMLEALKSLRDEAGEKILMLTGVRLGESAVRDQRIALSCSKDSGECGQGWFQNSTPDSTADTLAPLLHWRLCHVYDWIYFDDRHGYDAKGIGAIYGDGDIRTGCVGCNLASRDTALERLIRNPDWSYLSPLMELKPLYRELTKAKWRKRKVNPEIRKDGQYSKNVQRLGPLTMEARAFGLDTIIDIQKRSSMDLINQEEQARIMELWSLNTWPRKWSEEDAVGDLPIDSIRLSEGKLITQILMVR